MHSWGRISEFPGILTHKIALNCFHLVIFLVINFYYITLENGEFLSISDNPRFIVLINRLCPWLWVFDIIDAVSSSYRQLTVNASDRLDIVLIERAFRAEWVYWLWPLTQQYFFNLAHMRFCHLCLQVGPRHLQLSQQVTVHLVF